MTACVFLPSSIETTTPMVSPAASRPPTARCGSSCTLTSCRPSGTETVPGAPSASGAANRPTQQLLPRLEVDGGDPAGELGQVGDPAVEGGLDRQHLGAHQRGELVGRGCPRGSPASATSTSVVCTPARARASAPLT